MKTVKIDDFKNEKGLINWKAYSESQVKNGEKCKLCKKYIFHSAGGQGKEALCISCKGLGDDEKIMHDFIIRCPKCGSNDDVYDSEYFELLEDGQHDVTCQSCEHEFEITTRVNYVFESPEMIKKKGGG